MALWHFLHSLKVFHQNELIRWNMMSTFHIITNIYSYKSLLRISTGFSNNLRVSLLPPLAEEGWPGLGGVVAPVLSTLLPLMETRQFLCSESHAPVPQLVAPDVASEVAHGRAA